MIILTQPLNYREKQSQKANTGDEMKSPKVLDNSENVREGEKKIKLDNQRRQKMADINPTIAIIALSVN